jgi:hypothetical protein
MCHSLKRMAAIVASKKTQRDSEKLSKSAVLDNFAINNVSMTNDEFISKFEININLNWKCEITIYY